MLENFYFLGIEILADIYMIWSITKYVSFGRGKIGILQGKNPVTMTWCQLNRTTYIPYIA